MLKRVFFFVDILRDMIPSSASMTWIGASIDGVYSRSGLRPWLWWWLKARRGEVKNVCEQENRRFAIL